MRDQTQTGYGCEHQHGLGKLEACFGNGQGETERLKGSFPVATEPEMEELEGRLGYVAASAGTAEDIPILCGSFDALLHQGSAEL